MRTVGSPVFLAGVYLWGLTCLPVWTTFDFAFAGAMAWVSRGVSVVALGSLWYATALFRKNNVTAPWFGVWGFLGACCLTWVTAPALLRPPHLDAVQGMLAALGCVMLVLAWGASSARSDPPALPVSPSAEPHSPQNLSPLAPPKRVPGRRERAVRFVMVITLLFAVCAGAIGWWMFSPSSALMLHSVGGFFGIYAVSAVSCFWSTAAVQRAKAAEAVAHPARLFSWLLGLGSWGTSLLALTGERYAVFFIALLLGFFFEKISRPAVSFRLGIKR